MPRTGRPPNQRPTVAFQIRVLPAVLEQLRAIGRREGLTHGGTFSPSKVVGWLVERDRERYPVTPE